MFSRRRLLTLVGGALLLPDVALAGPREVVFYIEVLNDYGAHWYVRGAIDEHFAAHVPPVQADVEVQTFTFPEDDWLLADPAAGHAEWVRRQAGEVRVIRIQFHNWLELARADRGKATVGIGRALGVNVLMAANVTLLTEILEGFAAHSLQCRILAHEVAI